jgi:hypothetical protein
MGEQELHLVEKRLAPHPVRLRPLVLLPHKQVLVGG